MRACKERRESLGQREAEEPGLGEAEEPGKAYEGETARWDMTSRKQYFARWKLDRDRGFEDFERQKAGAQLECVGTQEQTRQMTTREAVVVRCILSRFGLREVSGEPEPLWGGGPLGGLPLPQGEGVRRKGPLLEGLGFDVDAA